jgi:hypothetical protein
MHSGPLTHPIYKLTSSEVDNLIHLAALSGVKGGSRLWHGFSFHEHTSESKSEDLFSIAKTVLNLLTRIRPEGQERDEWSVWLKSDRGDITELGELNDFAKEDERASYEELESFWRTKYPEPVQWRRLTVAHYDTHLFFTLQGALVFNVNLASGAFKGVDVGNDDIHRLIRWILETLELETHRFKGSISGAGPRRRNDSTIKSDPRIWPRSRG